MRSDHGGYVSSNWGRGVICCADDSVSVWKFCSCHWPPLASVAIRCNFYVHRDVRSSVNVKEALAGCKEPPSSLFSRTPCVSSAFRSRRATVPRTVPPSLSPLPSGMVSPRHAFERVFVHGPALGLNNTTFPCGEIGIGAMTPTQKAAVVEDSGQWSDDEEEKGQ